MCICTSIVLCSHVEPLAQFTVVQAMCGSHHTMALLQGKEVGSTVHTPVSYQLTTHTKHHFNLVLFGPCPLTVCGKHLVSLKALSWLCCILHSRKLSGEKFSRISRFCGYSQKFSPQNVWGVASFHDTSEQSTQVFSAKILFCGSFLPQKFSSVANMAVDNFF